MARKNYVFQIKNKTWKAEGFDKRTGKKITRNAKTKAEALEKLKEIESVIKGEKISSQKSITLNELANEFFNWRDHEKDVRKITRMKDRGVYSVIGQNLGKINLGKIGVGFFSELKNHMRFYPKDTIRGKKSLMVLIFEYGINKGYLPPSFTNDYLDDFKRKNIKTNNPIYPRDHVFTKKELETIWTNIPEYLSATIMHGKFGLLQGLRCSEICGLFWRDIDLEKNLIYVRNASTTAGFYRDMKSEAGARTLPILPAFISDIKNFLEISLERNITEEDLVFPRKIFRKYPTGHFHPNSKAKESIDANDIAKIYRKIFTKEKFPDFWRWNGMKDELIVQSHAFRRTFATRSADAGMPIQNLSRILGHSNVNTTMKYYKDTIEQKEMAMNFLNDYVIKNDITSIK